MTEQRKTAPRPIVENIPLELRQRCQWVVWAYELRKDKWTKVPYTPGTTDKARSNAPKTWRSFQEAWDCYQARSDFFAGIGFMFSKNDPYVGGDRDHSLSTEGLPPTYAEISPSGEGIKFIARASGHYGRKTVRGELYSSGRFFTITGRVLEGHERITECQDAIDTFLTSLGSTERRSSYASNGSRAQLAAAIPEDEWKEARRLLREDLNKLLAHLRTRAVSQTAGKETQLYYLLQENYSGFHQKWPGAGIVRGDGSIDSSQIRAVFANGVRMRSFTFPQFVALFYHFYGAECLAKWGTTLAFRQEAATLWARARTPRVGEAVPPPVQPAPRGRAGSHADLLERTYAVLESYKAGISAIVMLQEVANDLGVHKGTAQRAIQDLVGTRIRTEKYGQHGGLLIHFLPELIYSEDTAGDAPHSNGKGDEPMPAETDQIPELIYKTDILLTDAANADDMSAENKTASDIPELIYSPTIPRHDKKNAGVVSAKNDAHVYIESNTLTNVFLRGFTINSEKRRLDQIVAAAFDELPRSQPDPHTGELKRFPITNTRVVEWVEENYGSLWKRNAIVFWCDEIRKRRRYAVFRETQWLTRSALEKKAAANRKRRADLEGKAATAPMPEIAAHLANKAAQLGGYASILAREQQRRDTADDARIAAQGYTAGEQQEMLELVERERRDTDGLVERLRAAKVRRQNE